MGTAAGARLARPAALRPHRMRRAGQRLFRGRHRDARRAARRCSPTCRSLLDMTLMDDTPDGERGDARVAAGRHHSRRTKLRVNVRRATAPPPPATETTASRASATRSRSPTAEARAGRADRAIALLMRDAGSREDERAAAFSSRRSWRASWSTPGTRPSRCPFSSSSSPTSNRTSWRSGSRASSSRRPMALLYRVLTKTQADESTRQSLYLRICRLDPIQAISFSQS